MSRIDLAFFGRSTSSGPIVLKSPRRIEHDAKWRRVKDRAWFAAGCALVAAILFFGVLAMFMVAP